MILERPLETRFSRHTYPTHRTFVLMCGVKAPIGEEKVLRFASLCSQSLRDHYRSPQDFFIAGTCCITMIDPKNNMRQSWRINEAVLFHWKRQHRYDVFVKPRAEGKLAFTMPRRENDCCEETNVFVKPRAEGKLAFTMPRRENDCCEETNLFFNRYLINQKSNT